MHEKLLYFVTPYSSMRNESQASRLFNCHIGLSNYDVIIPAHSVDVNKLASHFENEIIKLLIEPSKAKWVILALLDIIDDDKELLEDTVIEQHGNFTKRQLSKMDKFALSKFLSGLFLYVIISVDNKVGLPSIKTITKKYVESFKDRVNTVSLAEENGTVALALAKNNLPKVTPYFSGRMDVLETIYNAFKGANEVAVTQNIHGLGGVGKSQTALKYAYNHLMRYDYICWISAEGETEIIASVRHILKFVFEAQEVDNIDKNEDLIELFKRHCQQHINVLLVFDNLENYFFIEKYTGNVTQAHILITTRVAHMQEVSVRLNLDVFSLPDALLFMKNRLGKEEAPTNSDVLCKRLGYLPLALEQAAAYIIANDRTVSIAF